MRNLYKGFYFISFTLIFLFTAAIPAQIAPEDISSNETKDSVSFTSSNLPIVVINTHGLAIKDDPKIMADMGIIFNGDGKRNNITDPFNNYNGKINIEIRGTSSQQFPKKQYSFDTIDSMANDNDVALLGFPTEHSWILSAPYTDKTLIRDALTYRLTNQMGRYASRSIFCELVLNGEYMGVYILFEKIKRDKNRVNIAKISAEDTTGDALTGGYILQIDRNEGSLSGWQSGYPPFLNARTRVFYQYNYPDEDDINPAQKKYIQDYIQSFEAKMSSSSFADSLTGYPALINISSFVDFFIVNEMNKNIDEFRLSFYLHKDKDSKGGKLAFGPVWDFNLAFGNANYYNASVAEGWHLDYLTKDLSFLSRNDFCPPFWIGKIFSEENIKLKIAQRWSELRQNILKSENVLKMVDSLALHLSEAQKRNFTRWRILGQWVWPNYYIGQTYSDEIGYLKGWIVRRFDWIDSELGSLTNVDGNPSGHYSTLPGSFVLYQNYPNPFNPVTQIRYTIPKASYVRLGIYDPLGKQIAVLVDDHKQAGTYTVSFDGNNLSSGIYFYKLYADEYQSSRKLIIVK